MFVCVAAQRVTFKITAQEYLTSRGSLLSLRFSVSAQSDDQSVSTMKVVSLKPPKLTVMVKHTHTCRIIQSICVCNRVYTTKSHKHQLVKFHKYHTLYDRRMDGLLNGTSRH